jgi:adenosylcobinamide-GDP ribazoletransferase
MTAPDAWIARLATDLKVALVFYTRLPLAHDGPIAGADLARASWAAPVAGALVGALGAAAYGLAHMASLGPLPASGLALVATMAVTGGLHEDGLADTADGFGAGTTPEGRLAIMRDSRIGTYGACALVMSIGLRWAALASLGGPTRIAAALIAAHMAARSTLPLLMRLTPPARPDGLSAAAGLPPPDSVAAAALLGLVALMLALGAVKGLIALALLLLGFWAMRQLALAKVGGQTGDVLGALEQVAEVLVLLAAARA